jgi:DNA-binding phage protein
MVFQGSKSLCMPVVFLTALCLCIPIACAQQINATATSVVDNSTQTTLPIDTTMPSPNTTTTNVPSAPTSTASTTTAAPGPGATPAPTTEAPACEPSCRVNLYFTAFLQTSNHIQASLAAVASASGVGTVARIAFNTRHGVYSGIPYGNGTLVTVTIVSYPAGTCNNYTNQFACATLVNRSNAPTIADSLALVGVTNGTLVPADATLPTFGILATVSSLYLALYCGSGLGYLLFLIWSAYKFLVAFQLMTNERARDAAESIGLTLEELEEQKRQEAAKNKKDASKRRKVPAPPLPKQQQVVDSYADAFGTTDVDDPAKKSLERIVSRMKFRTSASFVTQEINREQALHREMIPQPSKAVLDAVADAALPPVITHHNVFSIQHGGLRDAMQLPSSGDGAALSQREEGISLDGSTFQRRQPQSSNAASDSQTAAPTPVVVTPPPATAVRATSAAEREIDLLL